MDWTALQRTSLALPSGVPCLAVQSAREQQSLHTWYVQSDPAALRRWHFVMYSASVHAAATFYWQLGPYSVTANSAGTKKPWQLWTAMLGPRWGTVWFLRVQLCKCYAEILPLTYGILYSQSIFMFATAMAIHLDSCRLLLRYEHTSIAWCAWFSLVSFFDTACPLTWTPALLGWLVYPIPFWGLGSTATGLRHWRYAAARVQQEDSE